MMTARTRTRLTIALAITLAALAGLAFAQTAPGEDPAQLGNGLLVLLTAGAVAWFRETPIGKRVDGALTVPAFAMLTGAALSTGFETIGLLGFSPFVDALGRWWGATAAGLIVGAEAVFGVSLYRYGARALKRDPETGKLTVDPTVLAEAAGELMPANASPTARTAVAFVLDAARALLGREPLGEAMNAIYPLLVRYAQHPAVLTDQLRLDIQAQVLDVLRKAGLVGVDLGQDPAR